jgi:leucyl-tRNA synthetase
MRCFRTIGQAKPWNTAGISGVFWFLEKLCRLYFDEHAMIVTDEVPTKDNLKTLHKTTLKVADDIENFSFNTSVSQFMICVNELICSNASPVLTPLGCRYFHTHHISQRNYGRY